MVTVSVRMEEEEKRQLDEMLDAMGMTISTFYAVYTKKVLRERRIPFIIEASVDPFYSEENIAHIKKAERQIEKGDVVVKTLDELRELAGD